MFGLITEITFDAIDAKNPEAITTTDIIKI
jgi:hypothetical protein